jgi:hypothetical protein
MHNKIGFKVHADGLSVMLRHRGGPEALNSSPILRIMLYL